MMLLIFRMNRGMLCGCRNSFCITELSGYGDKKQGEEYFRYASISRNSYPLMIIWPRKEKVWFILLHSAGSFCMTVKIDTRSIINGLLLSGSLETL